MSSLALVNASTWVSGFDFTTRLNELSVEAAVEALEDTRFRAASSGKGRSRIGGLEDVETELNGFWESAASGSVDAAAFTGLGSSDEVVTHSVDGTEQAIAYMYRARKFSYQLGGEIGAVLPFTLGIQGASGNGSTGVVRGGVAAASQDVSATGVLGSPVNLGSLAADEHLYAVFHVFSAGTSISLKIESDDAQAFSTPADVSGATIGPLTATGGTWMARVAGPISDSWFRFNVTAITGTFTVAGAIGSK